MRKRFLLLQELQRGTSGGRGAQHRPRAAACAGTWQRGVVRLSWQGGSSSTAPAVGTPLTPSLSARRSLDRLDSVEILLPPKFPTWEEEYNQISDSANESSCINQVSCWRAEPRRAGTAQCKEASPGERDVLFPLQNKALAALQELHALFSKHQGQRLNYYSYEKPLPLALPPLWCS